MNWIVFAIVGSIAQLIDGALGMGFGLTSSTLLVTVGATAAVASAAVHFAEIGTTLASGLSHWQAENVDRKIMLRLAIPGSIGAFWVQTSFQILIFRNLKYLSLPCSCY